MLLIFTDSNFNFNISYNSILKHFFLKQNEIQTTKNIFVTLQSETCYIT